jgi:hypothetical protein
LRQVPLPIVSILAAAVLWADGGWCAAGRGAAGRTGDTAFSQCPARESCGPVPCPLNIDPVCGFLQSGGTAAYDNACVACADPNVQGYWPGTCGAACSDPRPEACTREYRPVCGRYGDGTRQTHPNGCDACADPRVVDHLPGECQ